MQAIRATAKKRMAGYCRVCPVCNGKACAGEVPGMGGLGTGAGFRANLDALAAWRLNMRVLHDVDQPDPQTTLLDLPLSMPVMAATIGGVEFNMGGSIAAAVQGQVCILADGGIRSGVDVLKMIALGADGVMIGRPFSVATIGGGEEGVKTYIDQICTELVSAMVLTGCRDLASMGCHILRPAPPAPN